jgi:hypothetical protein
MSAYPIIRLEVEGMRRTITAALLEHQAKFDEDVINAVNDYCRPENIANVVRAAARTALDTAITEEVRNFFTYGKGRTAVAEAVKTTLLSRKSFTPLDEVGD